jgi:CDGSH-type Zn-finger protein
MASKEKSPEAFEARPYTAVDAPFVCDAEPGVYWWCACGKSERQPFCDGSHRGGRVGPVVVTVATAREVAWCGCKRSSTAPFCDFSHRCGSALA